MKALVTGGTGFLGIPLIERLLAKNFSVRTIARNEGKLIELQQQFPQVEIYPGSIEDRFAIRQAMKNIDCIFHLAANKHVGLSETFTRECIQANTIGSLNIFEQSLEQDIKYVISISTDKAAQIAGVYGASKMLMERLARQYQQLNEKCKYRIVRYGNVLYSTGSVLCKWKDLIEQGKELIITEPNATRFFWTVEKAVDLIFECLDKADGPEPWIPEMKSMRIGDLLQAMINKYSNGKEIPIKVIGLQNGENLHEKILENGLTSLETQKYTIDEITTLI